MSDAHRAYELRKKKQDKTAEELNPTPPTEAGGNAIREVLTQLFEGKMPPEHLLLKAEDEWRDGFGHRKPPKGEK